MVNNNNKYFDTRYKGQLLSSYSSSHSKPGFPCGRQAKTQKGLKTWKMWWYFHVHVLCGCSVNMFCTSSPPPPLYFFLFFIFSIRTWVLQGTAKMAGYSSMKSRKRSAHGVIYAFHPPKLALFMMSQTHNDRHKMAALTSCFLDVQR